MNFNIEEAKYISNQFIKYVKGNSAHVLNEKGHDGAVGHLLEDLFKLSRNSDAAADFDTIELKKASPNISFGDWSGDIGEYSCGAYKPKDGRKGKQEYLDDYGRVNEKGEQHVTGPFYGDGTEGAGFKRTGLELLIVNNNLYLINVKTQYKVLGWSYKYLEQKIINKFGRGTAKVGIDKINNVFDD